MSEQMDIFTQLKSEHEEVKELLSQAEEAKASQREGLLKKIKAKLVPHARAEEKTIYAALHEAGPKKPVTELSIEAYAEHEAADHLLSELEKTSVDDEMWKGRFLVLKENVEHHIREEEKELFSKARKYIGDETAAMMYKAYNLEKKKFESSLPTQHQIKAKSLSSHLSSEASM